MRADRLGASILLFEEANRYSSIDAGVFLAKMHTLCIYIIFCMQRVCMMCTQHKAAFNQFVPRECTHQISSALQRMAALLKAGTFLASPTANIRKQNASNVEEFKKKKIQGLR